MQVQTRRRDAPMDPTAGTLASPAWAPRETTTPRTYTSASAGLANAGAPGGASGRKTGQSAKKARRRDPLWARLTVVLGALLMMGSGGTIIGGKVLISQATGSITQTNLLGDAQKTVAPGGKALKGPINMLMLGVDRRQSWDANDARADTIIILHIPASHDQAYLISIPRDAEGQIPAFGPSGYRGGTDKINAAFYFGAQGGAGFAGGAQLMAKTVKKMTGVSFDGAAIIDFSGFRKVIDALGTVRMCVDHEVESIHLAVDKNGNPHSIKFNDRTKQVYGIPKGMHRAKYEVGCREMKGWEALDYSRQRYGLPNSDYDRQRHQQQLIKAMAKKATSSGVLTNPLKIKSMMEAAGKAFTLDTGGVPIEDFVFTLKGVAANDLVLLRTNNGTFSSNGEGREVLNSITLDMFRAISDDTVAQFILDHPDVVAKS